MKLKYRVVENSVVERKGVGLWTGTQALENNGASDTDNGYFGVACNSKRREMA